MFPAWEDETSREGYESRGLPGQVAVEPEKKGFTEDRPQTGSQISTLSCSLKTPQRFVRSKAQWRMMGNVTQFDRGHKIEMKTI